MPTVDTSRQSEWRRHIETARSEKKEMKAANAMMRSRWTTVEVSGGSSSPPFGSLAKVSIARSMSPALSTGVGTRSIASDGATALADCTK